VSQTAIDDARRPAQEAHRQPTHAAGSTALRVATPEETIAAKPRTAAWFVAKAAVFSALLVLVLVALERLVTAATPWRDYEDPRARILWDGAFDGTRVVLIGDSIFASLYVDFPSEMLWARLEEYSGERVFPGALNGARPRDIFAAAMHLSTEWPAGTVVFVSLPPTRFVATRAPEPLAGNFADAFLRQHGIDSSGDSALRRLRGHIYRYGLKPFFAERTRSALANVIDRPRQPGWMRDRVWTQEVETARSRFQFFERNLLPDAGMLPIEWVLDVQQRLEAAGMRPVFVLTGLNEALVRRFSTIYPADMLLGRLRGIAGRVRAGLERHDADVIDLTDGVPAECFFDLVHPSACGDDAMAQALSEWLARHSHD
jgi:hypothetical protein